MGSEKYLLTITEGPNAGQAYPLPGIVCTLGRTPDNAIVIDSPRISRHHAQLKPVLGGLEIEDLNSTNGTWVNGKRLTAPHVLSPGDIIELADYITMRFETLSPTMAEQLTPLSFGSAPQVMGGAQPHTPPPPSSQHHAASSHPTATPTTPPVILSENQPQRSTWSYVIIVTLIILICLCLAAAVYLWFAPYEFWVKVFDLFNVPLP